jgi:hypothetical protein
MDKNVCKLEDLPNEILIEVFKNLDARYLFRAFYNLNVRFNNLLQSLNHCLTIFTPDSDVSVDDEIFFPYIHTLIIKNGLDIIFDHIINVRRVILHHCQRYSMTNLQINIASSVEHLSVLSTHPWLLNFSNDFIRKIFSNDFPYLKSCCLPHAAVILVNKKWTQSPSLRIFKIGYIRSNIYKSILSSCPNLISFKFSKLPLDESKFQVESHMNLKRMVIDLCLNDFLNSYCLNDHLLSVPKLEQLTIHVILRDSQNIMSIKDCNWFSSIIDSYLPMLQEFYCYLIFTPSTNINDNDNENILNQIKRKFEQIHNNNRYQSKILFKFSD